MRKHPEDEWPKQGSSPLLSVIEQGIRRVFWQTNIILLWRRRYWQAGQLAVTELSVSLASQRLLCSWTLLETIRHSPFITRKMCWEKRVLLRTAVWRLHRIPRVGERMVECRQGPYRISQRNPTPGGSWMKALDSSSVLGNIQIGFCRHLENILAVCLQVTQQIRSKGFKCKGSVWTWEYLPWYHLT